MSPQLFRVTAVTLSLLVASPLLAQEATDDAGAAVETTEDTAVVATDATPVVATQEDDGFDWGWLGLLGLAGLAGLRRRDDHVVHTTTSR